MIPTTGFRRIYFKDLPALHGSVIKIVDTDELEIKNVEVDCNYKEGAITFTWNKSGGGTIIQIVKEDAVDAINRQMYIKE